jgi:hypothetical protein
VSRCQGGCLELGIVAHRSLGGRHVADRLKEAAVVVPVDPLEGGELDGLQGAPGGTVKLRGAWRAGPGRVAGGMSSPAAKAPYVGHRFPAEVISQAGLALFPLPTKPAHG